MSCRTRLSYGRSPIQPHFPPDHHDRMKVLAFVAALLLGAGVATAQQVELGSGSVAETVMRLKPGEYVWSPQIAPAGPMLLIVNLTSQRAVLYRNGLPVAATSVSTGRPGYRTPTGVFTILQKHVEHYSTTYDNAPMPYMQRLTWRGIALHAGQLPGYPASHGCIRLPAGFAKLLYGVTRLGMTVVIAEKESVPRIAPTPSLALAGKGQAAPGQSTIEWTPQAAPTGPVSIVVSASDRRAFVLRNGVLIGSGPVQVEGPVNGTWAYALERVDASGQHWVRVQLSSAKGPAERVPVTEWQRFRAPEEFRRKVASIIEAGTTIVVTADSVKPGTAVTVLDSEEPRPAPDSRR